MRQTSTVPFAGTKEQEAQLKGWLEAHKDQYGQGLAALQEAQEIYGYVPYEVQKMISEGLNMPLEEIYGIATFYSQFSLTPKGKYKISVCLGTACYVRGAGPIHEKMQALLGISEGECTADGKYSIEACRCIGACGLAPVLTINDDVYGRLTGDEAELKAILAKYED